MRKAPLAHSPTSAADANVDHLISLPEDLVEAIATRASLEGEAQLSGTRREFWARYHRKRAGVSLAGLALSHNRRRLRALWQAMCGHFLRPWRARGPATRGATRPWTCRAPTAAGRLKKHLDAPAERAAAAAEREKLAFPGPSSSSRSLSRRRAESLMSAFRVD